VSVDPDWLPKLENLSVYEGDRARYFKAVYQIFRNDFILNETTCYGKPVIAVKGRMDDDKEESFWHIVTEDK